MTHDDIVQAAFRVWGREAYRKMSLTDVAAELGVTKPALYRHFRDKDGLLAAMRSSFFDRYAEAMRSAFPAGLTGLLDSSASTLRMVEALAAHFGSSPGDLAFMFARILRLPEFDRIFSSELAARGVPTNPAPAAGSAEMVQAHMAIGTCFFMVAFFHLQRTTDNLEPSPGELAALVASTVELVGQGLDQGAGTGARPTIGKSPVDYVALETKARLSQAETAAADGLLPAVAAVVAEVGSWDASMDMVAKRSGLSKSGLYSHFRSKEDMLMRLFEAEFERITATMADRLAGQSGTPERLYLAMATAAEYLVARPDILVALDWLRMQRLGIPGQLPTPMLELFSFLQGKKSGLRLIGGSLGLTVRWILFMTVHQLMRSEEADASSRARNMRMLHGFLLGGLRVVPAVAPWADPI